MGSYSHTFPRSQKPTNGLSFPSLVASKKNPQRHLHVHPECPCTCTSGSCPTCASSRSVRRKAVRSLWVRSIFQICALEAFRIECSSMQNPGFQLIEGLIVPAARAAHFGKRRTKQASRRRSFITKMSGRRRLFPRWRWWLVATDSLRELSQQFATASGNFRARSPLVRASALFAKTPVAFPNTFKKNRSL